MSTFVRNVNVKRRKRISSKGLNTRPEIKQMNFITGSNLYTAMSITPFTLNENALVYRPFYGIQMYMPAQGTGSNQRIGLKINVKWIRFKGYVTVYDRQVSNCRVKLFLIRSYGKSLSATDFTNMFNDWQNVNYADADLWNIMTNMRHNYYKATVKPNSVGRDKGVVMNKICEFKIHPSSHSMDTRASREHIIQLSSSQATVPKVFNVNMTDYETVDNFPLDIKVSVQETIDCAVDHYYLYAMQDYPYAVDNDFKTTTGYPTPAKVSGYEANFFGRVYFTDA